VETSGPLKIIVCINDGVEDSRSSLGCSCSPTCQQRIPPGT